MRNIKIKPYKKCPVCNALIIDEFGRFVCRDKSGTHYWYQEIGGYDISRDIPFMKVISEMIVFYKDNHYVRVDNIMHQSSAKHTKSNYHSTVNAYSSNYLGNIFVKGMKNINFDYWMKDKQMFELFPELKDFLKGI